MKVLALDVGEKRIGIALSDSLGMTAQGHSVLERQNKSRDFHHILDLCQQNEVSRIVVGLPLNMNGTVGPKALEIQGFAAELGAFTGLEIVFWDERLSTVSAERTLLEADVSRKKRKGLRDKLAAVYILQTYLDRESRSI
ncbi:MAG TPA: Holliday junction resolvase RuvX [Syntrophomonadaceae bacterium]|nr:Holliday junction resolvase RuvX [Syntrophomonadaceae bacterium]